ncbi:MAG: cytochrome bc complex cytochrome b subunit [Bacteroidota bacterium]
MKTGFLRSLHERAPIDMQRASQVLEHFLLKEPIPVHMKNWFYALGATPLTLFVFQVITGILLTFYYVPSPELAYESVRYISEEARMGFWIRGLHHWGSTLMVITIFLHMARVFFTRAYRKPRELNWILGMLLLITTLGLCFTGYSLVYNQLSYWATTVGTNMIQEIPLVGPFLVHLLRGGESVGSNTLTRLFNLHIGILPTLLFALLVTHILLIRIHGVARLEGHEKDEATYSFYPEHFYHAVIITLMLVTFMSAMTVILPPGMGEPANPDVTPNHIKPEWYFFAVYSILKIVPLRWGIYFFVAVILATTFWPFLDDLLRNRWPGRRIDYAVGSLTIILFLAFTVYELIVY